MEIIHFYGFNILAACFLGLVLAMAGQHIMARNKSIEIMLLGQELQTSILLSSGILSYFAIDHHSEHALHEESFLSLTFALVFHLIYSKFAKRLKNYQVELAMVMIVLLVALNHLLVSLSPFIEMHMTTTMLGDLVTVSNTEAVFASIVSIICIFYFLKNSNQILQDSIEISIFQKKLTKNNSVLLFNFVVLVLMFLSVHLFGIYFTLANILIPPLLFNLGQIERKFYLKTILIIPVLVILSFLLLKLNDRLPTTIVFVLLLALFFALIVQFLRFLHRR